MPPKSENMSRPGIIFLRPPGDSDQHGGYIYFKPRKTLSMRLYQDIKRAIVVRFLEQTY